LTFIVHTSNLEDRWKDNIATRTKAGPCFIAFDHGDHLHILFNASTGGENLARTRTRIAQYLGCKSSGVAEATITCVKVRYLRKFILYCVRYGIERTHLYGNKRQTELAEALNEFKLLFAHRDPNDVLADARCEEYHDDRKERITKRMGNTKSKHLADIIIQKIQETDVNSAQEWENVVPPKFKLQLIKEVGLSVDSYIQKIIRIVKTENITQIKTRSLTELYTQLMDEQFRYEVPDDPDFKAIISWLEFLFLINDIDMIEFLPRNEIVKTQRYMKINCVVLEGYTNAGKSLIVDNLIGICKPEEIPRERDNSGFHLDQLPAAACALFEEPIITPTNVGTWKLLLEGKVVKTDIKHKDKEGIKRIPIWITTATPITNNVDANESIQLQQRIKLWKFKKYIEHRTDIHTLNTELSRRLIRKAPGFVRPIHFAFLWFWNFKAILSRIHDLDEKHIKNRDGLRLSGSVIEVAESWQIRLRDTWAKETTTTMPTTSQDPAESELEETQQQQQEEEVDRLGVKE